MKKRTLYILFGLEIIICLMAAFMQLLPADLLKISLIFPFEAFGLLLRRMSLSGSIGNGIATALYVVLCASPFVYMLSRIVKRKGNLRGCRHPEEWLLLLLSLLLFAGLYLFINPALFSKLMPMEGSGGEYAKQVGGMMVSSCIYSVAVGYGILRVLRGFGRKNTGLEIQKMIKLLWAVTALLIFQICFLSLQDTFSAVTAMADGNTGAASGQRLVTGTVIVLHYICENIPLVMDIMVIALGITFLEAVEKDLYGEQAQKTAEQIYRVCRWAVCLQVLAPMGMNLLQMVLAPKLLDADYNVSIPLISITITLAVMLGVRYLAHGRALKEENDLFV